MFQSSPRPLEQRVGQVARQRLAAAQHLQAGVTAPAGLEQHPPGRRRRLHDRRAGRASAAASALGVMAASRRRCTTRAPTIERQEQLEHRDVERQRRHREQHVVARSGPARAASRQEVRERAVLDRDPFGLPVEPEV